MADNVPPSDAGVTKSDLCRLRTLTFLSLTLNVLILLAIVVGCVVHHHMEKKREFGKRGGYGGGGWKQQMMGWRGGPRFQRFGGMRWGGPGGPGASCPMMNRGNGFATSGGPGGMGGGNGPTTFNKPGGFGAMGFGRGPGGGPPDPSKMTDGILAMLTNKLSLTDDEKAKIRPIVQDQVTDLQKQMEAQRAAMQKQIEDAKAKIRPLLTPDQQKQLDALPVPGGGPPPGPPEPANPGP